MTVFVSELGAASPADSPVIALVRHGETEWNRERRIQGRTEVPLNETGRVQATAAGTQLAALAAGSPQLRWRGLLASPLGRALETAELIAPSLGLGDPDIDEAFLERDFGPAEGLEIEEINERWPGLEIPGAESLSELAHRAASAIARVLDSAPHTVVVAHGALLRSGLAELTGADVPRILNGQIWLLRRTPTGFEAQALEEDLVTAAQK